jgi:hypothetical protein
MTSQIISTCLTRHFWIGILVLFFLSCTNTSQLVCKEKAGGNRIRFFKNRLTKPKKNLSNFYAQVDSENVKIYYTFFSTEINKTYGNDDNARYVLTSNKQPMSPLTEIDSVVLAKADTLMDSLNYEDLKRAKGATGYEIEILRTP